LRVEWMVNRGSLNASVQSVPSSRFCENPKFKYGILLFFVQKYSYNFQTLLRKLIKLDFKQ